MKLFRSSILMIIEQQNKAIVVFEIPYVSVQVEAAALKQKIGIFTYNQGLKAHREALEMCHQRGK